RHGGGARGRRPGRWLDALALSADGRQLRVRERSPRAGRARAVGDAASRPRRLARRPRRGMARRSGEPVYDVEGRNRDREMIMPDTVRLKPDTTYDASTS